MVNLEANGTRFMDQLPGPELLYSPKVTWSVRGEDFDHTVQPAGAMLSRKEFM